MFALRLFDIIGAGKNSRGELFADKLALFRASAERLRMRQATLSTVRQTVFSDNSLTPRERAFWEGALASPASWELPRIMRPKEVSEALGVTPPIVREYARLGLLRSVNPTGKRRAGYTEESVKALLRGEVSRRTGETVLEKVENLLREALGQLGENHLERALKLTEEALRTLSAVGGPAHD